MNNVNEEKLNAVLGEINLIFNNFVINTYGNTASLFEMVTEDIPSEIIKIFATAREQIENSDLNDEEKSVAWAIVSREILIQSLNYELQQATMQIMR